MPLVNSPSFENYETPLEGDEGVVRRGSKQTMLWVLLGVLIGVVVLLSLFNLFLTYGADGTVTGVVRDSHGNPLQAEIFILGSDISTVANPDGSFQLERISTGKRNLVVGYNGIGTSIEVDVAFRGTTDAGIIVIDTPTDDDPTQAIW